MRAEVAPDSLGLAFADPVGGTQRAFRLLLLAMSRPGTIVDFPAGDLSAQDLPLGHAATAVALTLVDLDTPIWLGDGYEAALGYLRFHCGARTSDAGACRFAFAASSVSLPDLNTFDLGSAEFPDRSTTLVLEVGHLHPGDANSGMRLMGPGLERAARLDVGGTDARLWRQWQQLRPLFPRGIDLILTCGGQLAALPRTTLVEI